MTTATTRQVLVGDLTVGPDGPLTLIGGPCVIESADFTLRMAEQIKKVCARHEVNYVFKASFDKANRTSIDSFRGPGLSDGLAVLDRVRKEIGLPVLTDVHESSQVADVAEVVDVLQIPAFLCRQTDLLLAAARSGRVVNVKKAQFLSPPEMAHVVIKLEEGGAAGVLVTERGSSFGYNTLVVDFRSLPQLASLGWPVIFDATHSVQAPGGLDGRSGGQRQYVPHLARAAVAVGVDGVFMEIHEDPEHAPSDGPNMVPLDRLDDLLRSLLVIREAARSVPIDDLG